MSPAHGLVVRSQVEFLGAFWLFWGIGAVLGILYILVRYVRGVGFDQGGIEHEPVPDNQSSTLTRFHHDTEELFLEHMSESGSGI
jgi:Na+-transporting methylmalonyl-CoA/oxaloacetate decarboxylase gamma subunit